MDLGLAQASTLHIFTAKPWLADGLNEPELAVVQSLETIARRHQSVALGLVTKPFLRTVEAVDVFLLDEFEAQLGGLLPMREASLVPSTHWQASHGWPTGSTSLSAPYWKG